MTLSKLEVFTQMLHRNKLGHTEKKKKSKINPQNQTKPKKGKLPHYTTTLYLTATKSS